ncbi:hypothetical protein [Vagococcus sp. WN89Y]|uniref:hypothetical protein n=1 Tax=Vagococcus sp. WN89Y TaxID=3457258 RepID=UPI003FCC9868
MDNLSTKLTEQEAFYQRCINEFGDIEDAMENVAQRAAGNNFLCSEYLCGNSVQSCTNLY